MKLQITQADCNAGRAVTPNRNPLTCAIFRQCGWSYAYQDGYLYSPVDSRVRVPDEVRNWLHLLLTHPEKATPREYDLDLPEPSGTDKPHPAAARKKGAT